MAGQLTVEQRKQIVILYQSGCNIKEIQRRIGTTRKTIRYWLRRYTEDGDVTSHRRQHYPRSTTAEQDAAIIAAHKEQPSLTTTMTAIRHNISTETVRRRLKEGLKLSVPTKKNCNEGLIQATGEKDLTGNTLENAVQTGFQKGSAEKLLEKAGTSVEDIEKSLEEDLRKHPMGKIEISVGEAEETFKEDKAFLDIADFSLEKAEELLKKEKGHFNEAHLKEESPKVAEYWFKDPLDEEEAKDFLEEIEAPLEGAEESLGVAEDSFKHTLNLEVLLQEAQESLAEPNDPFIEEVKTLKEGLNSVEKAKPPLVDEEESLKSVIKDSESKSKTSYCGVCSQIPENLCGYRYVCLECMDSEICETCYLDGQHSLHYVLRIPIHKPWKEVKSVLQNLREQLLEITEDEMKLKNEKTLKPHSSVKESVQTVNKEQAMKQNFLTDEQEVRYNRKSTLEPDPLMTDTMLAIQIPEVIREVNYRSEKVKAMREKGHCSRMKMKRPRILPKGTHSQNQNKSFTLLHALLLNTNTNKRTLNVVDMESEPRNKTKCYNRNLTKDKLSDQKVIKSESVHCAHSVERESCMNMSCRTKR